MFKIKLPGYKYLWVLKLGGRPILHSKEKIPFITWMSNTDSKYIQNKLMINDTHTGVCVRVFSLKILIWYNKVTQVTIFLIKFFTSVC